MKSKIVVGLGFGDEGKGMAVAHEVERVIDNGLQPVVVRFNGGPQAAHNVRIKKDGKILHHTHSQFGSGALLGAETIITKGMLFDPLSFVNEAEALSKTMGTDMMDTVTIDGRCPVVTPLHVAVNRILEESRGDGRHGSTGSGIGIARECEEEFSDHITVHSLSYGALVLVFRLIEQRDWLEKRYRLETGIGDETIFEWILLMQRAMRRIAAHVRVVFGCGDEIRRLMDDGSSGVVFEGSQGILLDERYGWFPHVTRGDMSPSEATKICGHRPFSVLGVTRSYLTRHGAGPFPSECAMDWLGYDDNSASEWAGELRVGLLDVPSLTLSAKAAGVNEVAVSHMDEYPGSYVAAWHNYRRDEGVSKAIGLDPLMVTASEERFMSRICDVCNAPTTVIGRGPTTDDWQDR